MEAFMEFSNVAFSKAFVQPIHWCVHVCVFSSPQHRSMPLHKLVDDDVQEERKRTHYQTVKCATRKSQQWRWACVRACARVLLGGLQPSPSRLCSRWSDSIIEGAHRTRVGLVLRLTQTGTKITKRRRHATR